MGDNGGGDGVGGAHGCVSDGIIVGVTAVVHMVLVVVNGGVGWHWVGIYTHTDTRTKTSRKKVLKSTALLSHQCSFALCV